MRLRAYVKGRVHNVGFRYFVRNRAEELGLDGWVRNLPDGRVEVEAIGPPEQLDWFEELLRKGPVGSRVDSVRAERSNGTPDGSGFHINFI